ncbi:MAG: permease-like cell division protein FtsX [Methyloprofundus sp.]|nr:permease-like cell division protein FtsX [Methyloprofundus sp.]
MKVAKKKKIKNIRGRRKEPLKSPNERKRLLFSWQYNALFCSARRLLKTPASSAMTILVIAIAMSLAGGFYVALSNSQHVFDDVQMGRQISLYLYEHVNDDEAMLLAGQLKNKKQVAKVAYISKQQALDEFQMYSGFSGALNALANNPLPRVIQVYPETKFSESIDFETLLQFLEAQPAVEFAQMDMQWVSRLQAMMGIVHNFSHALTVLLIIAVILITGNSIRLELQTRRDEIRVEKLVGASNAYIYRPFLYTGFWYGFLAGVLAWLIIAGIVLLLESPVEQLLALYHSAYQLRFMGLNDSIVFIILSSLLGVLGALIAASQQIKNITNY